MEYILDNTQGTDLWDDDTSSVTSDMELRSDIWDVSLASNVSSATHYIHEGSIWDSTSGSDLDLASLHSGSGEETATRPCTGVELAAEGDSDIDMKTYWDVEELTPHPSRTPVNVSDLPEEMISFFADLPHELPVRDKPPNQLSNISSPLFDQPSGATISERHDSSQELGEELLTDLALAEESLREVIESGPFTDSTRYVLPPRGANLLDITNYDYYQRNLTATPERWTASHNSDEEDEDQDQPTGLGQWVVHGGMRNMSPCPRPRPLPDVSPWTTFGDPFTTSSLPHATS